MFSFPGDPEALLGRVGRKKRPQPNTASELGGMDRLDADALRVLFTIELGGEGFYRALADPVGNEEAARSCGATVARKRPTLGER